MMTGKRAGTLTTLAVAALLIGGCTPPADEAPPPQTSPPTSQPASPPATSPPASPGASPSPSQPGEGTEVDADLTIVLTSAGSNYREERTFRCEDSQPVEGTTIREPEAACAALEQHSQDVFFSLPDPERSCTQEYGGPAQAHVTGTINGREVDKRFSLTDGCKISEWNSMQALLGGPAGEV
ncbi:hypothetical protein D477_002923 [Arthrobacter crystallopoietes BAB-32]|uniref:Uncharacterized protein n=1 Tax=Arthrobacter crystallopoietes BAB-32 TaxID=1246476 RepID=N1VBN3_9MICC|nr:hypothetical protein [Arthrobacter crystallopoietes]EMY35703.1 hypothetical protein D477_002923 [Arthrobacter crystallopoietes BAB-32]